MFWGLSNIWNILDWFINHDVSYRRNATMQSIVLQIQYILLTQYFHYKNLRRNFQKGRKFNPHRIQIENCNLWQNGCSKWYCNSKNLFCKEPLTSFKPRFFTICKFNIIWVLLLVYELSPVKMKKIKTLQIAIEKIMASKS